MPNDEAKIAQIRRGVRDREKAPLERALPSPNSGSLPVNSSTNVGNTTVATGVVQVKVWDESAVFTRIGANFRNEVRTNHAHTHNETQKSNIPSRATY